MCRHRVRMENRAFCYDYPARERVEMLVAEVGRATIRQCHGHSGERRQGKIHGALIGS